MPTVTLYLSVSRLIVIALLAAVIRFFDTAQGKAQGQVVMHSSVIVSAAINQQGIAPDRQVPFLFRWIMVLSCQCRQPDCPNLCCSVLNAC